MFPQWVQVDLGATTSIGKVTLKLPPPTAWATRTQTLSVQGSTDGTNFSTIVASAGYVFDPSTGNTVNITFPATNARYVRLNITANTGWPAGQLSDFEVFATSGGTGSATLSGRADDADVPVHRRRQQQRVAGRDGVQHRYGNGDRLVDHRHRRLHARQHLRRVDCRRRELHGHGDVPPDRRRYPYRDADHRQQRDEPVADRRR